MPGFLKCHKLLQQLPYQIIIKSLVFFIKYYYSTQNTMQIHSKLSQRYEETKHRTVLQDTEEAWSKSSCWWYGSNYDNLDTSRCCPHFLLWIKTHPSISLLVKSPRTSVQIPRPGLSGVRIAGSGLITKVVLLICDGVEIIYPCPCGVYLISRQSPRWIWIQLTKDCDIVTSGDKQPVEGFMQEAQGWT